MKCFKVGEVGQKQDLKQNDRGRAAPELVSPERNFLFRDFFAISVGSRWKNEEKQTNKQTSCFFPLSVFSTNTQH